MARKPIEQLSPKYRQRIERAMAAGKSRQAARGKPVAEHVQRRQREAVKVRAAPKGKTVITDAMNTAMRNFVYRQAARQRAETKFEMWARMKGLMRQRVEEHGWGWFAYLKAEVAAKEGTPKVQELDDLEDDNDFDHLDIPGEYIALRFYA